MNIVRPWLRIAALCAIVGCDTIPTARQLEVEKLLGSVRIGLKENEILATLGVPQSTVAGPFEVRETGPGCGACTAEDVCDKTEATRRSDYEWRVPNRPGCNSTSTNIYSLKVYYDLFNTVRCVESGHGMEFTVIHV